MPFFWFPIWSIWSTADLLTVVSDRIAGAFSMSEVTWAVELDRSEAFDRVGHAGLLHKLNSYGFSEQIFGLISSFFSNRQFRWFWMGRLYKNIHLMLDFLKAPFLVLHFFFFTLMTFFMMLSLILLSMLMILLSRVSLIKHLFFGKN